MKEKMTSIITNSETMSKGLDDKRIAEALESFGYNEEKRARFRQKLTRAKELVYSQTIERQQMLNANQEFFDKRLVVDKVIKNDVRLCSMMFTVNPGLASNLPAFLSINSYGIWYNGYMTFYKGLLSNSVALNILAECKFTEDKIKDRIAMLEEVNDLNAARGVEKGEAEAATIERDNAVADLYDERRRIREFARQALGADSQLLEIIGMKVAR